jgi:hypothetical protein
MGLVINLVEKVKILSKDAKKIQKNIAYYAISFAN